MFLYCCRVTPLSSHKKRSNLKNTETPSPMVRIYFLKFFLEHVNFTIINFQRSKRVSFAEPIVSGRQDSPNILQDIQVYNNYYKQSPNTKKKMKASRKLLMAPKGLLIRFMLMDFYLKNISFVASRWVPNYKRA